MPPYRILVVDDSALMRKIISDMVNSDARLSVAGTAQNGREAVEAVKRLRPDAVTMDIEMPEMNGLEALSVIMKETPIPVVMLSSTTQEGTAATIRALELGAFDFVAKPSGPISMDLHLVQETLLTTLHSAATGTKAAAGKLQKLPVPPPNQRAQLPFAPGKLGGAIRRIAAVGTSTGGPRALQQVLSKLPAHFPAPILVVQHMPPGFTRSLAQRLDALCAIRVKEAEDGMEPVSGTAYIAPGGFHMCLRREHGRYRIRLTRDPPRSGHRPSVDVLFESLADFPELDRTVVLLTGMGTDGSKGMKLLFDRGVKRTIAEDEETCIIFGMPRAAIELGCVNKTLPLGRIAEQIIAEVTNAEEV